MTVMNMTRSSLYRDPNTQDILKEKDVDRMASLLNLCIKVINQLTISAPFVYFLLIPDCATCQKSGTAASRLGRSA